MIMSQPGLNQKKRQQSLTMIPLQLKDVHNQTDDILFTMFDEQQDISDIPVDNILNEPDDLD